MSLSPRMTIARQEETGAAAVSETDRHRTRSAADDLTGTSGVPFAALLAFTGVLLIAPQALYPPLQVLRPAFLAAAFAAGTYLFERFQTGQPVFGDVREFRLAGWLLGWCVVTIPFSYWPGGSFAVLQEQFIKTLIIFWLLGSVIDSVPRSRKLAWTLSAISAYIAFEGIRQYHVGILLEDSERIVGYAAALTANPNDLALMLNLILPLSVALLVTRERLLPRVVLLAIIGLSLVSIVLTFSRGGFITLVTIAFLYLLRLVRSARLGTAIVLVLCGLLALPFVPSRYTERISTITDIEADKTGSAQTRWAMMTAGTRFIAGHPIVGAGLGQNVLALNEVLPGNWHTVHNAYLEYGMDLGLPGMILYLLLLRAVLRRARRVAEESVDPEARALGDGLRVSLLAFTVGALFHPVAYHFYFYYFAGLTLGLHRVVERQRALEALA